MAFASPGSIFADFVCRVCANSAQQGRTPLPPARQRWRETPYTTASAALGEPEQDSTDNRLAIGNQ